MWNVEYNIDKSHGHLPPKHGPKINMYNMKIVTICMIFLSRVLQSCTKSNPASWISVACQANCLECVGVCQPETCRFKKFEAQRSSLLGILEKRLGALIVCALIMALRRKLQSLTSCSTRPLSKLNRSK